MLLGKVCKVRTGKLDANAGSPNGKYPFFTCAQTPLKIDFYRYDCECVLIAGNCDLNVKYFNGKFEAYQRTYIIESLDKQRLDTKYLYYYLSSYLDNLKNKRAGGVIKFIKLGDLTSIEIPNLELNEQVKRVHELETIEYRKKAEKDFLICYDSLIKSRFNEMFLNNNFPIKKWDDVLEIINGKDYKGHEGNVYPVYGSGGFMNIYTNNYLVDGTLTIIGRKGTIDKPYLVIGKIWNIDTAFAIKTNSMILNPIYFYYRSKFYDYLSLNLQTTKPSLRKKDLIELEIELPPISLQEKFVLFVNQIDKLKFN